MKQKKDLSNTIRTSEIYPRFSTFTPISKIHNALHELNCKSLDYKTTNHCKVKRPAISNCTIIHKSTIHYCSLIKRAILKRNWAHVVKLLIAYIEEPKAEKFAASILYKFTLVYLLNDPIAQSRGLLNEFLQLALSCHTEADQREFLKMLTTLPIVNAIVK